VSFEFSRNIRDTFYRRWKAAPLPGNVNWCDSYIDDEVITYLPIDIGELRPTASRPEGIDVEIAFSAAPLLGDGKSITASLYHSDAEQSGYAETVPAITAHVTGTGGSGAAARVMRLTLPPDAKPYLVLRLEADADAAPWSGCGVEFSLLF
jgi:hypothetical protein